MAAKPPKRGLLLGAVRPLFICYERVPRTREGGFEFNLCVLLHMVRVGALWQIVVKNSHMCATHCLK